MSDSNKNCGTCATGTDEEVGVAPEAFPLTTHPMQVPAPQVVNANCNVVSPSQCFPTKQIVSQCSCCPQPDQLVACLKLVSSVPMPACQAEADLEFSGDVSKLTVGLNIWANGIGTLRITSIVNARKLRVKNLCENTLIGVGETIPAGTCFAWGIPYSPQINQSPNSGAFLDQPGFVVPAVSACNVVKIKNAVGIAVGQIISLAGYNYRVGSQIDSSTFTLCNDNNGAAPNTIIQADANGDGDLDWPIVVQQDPDVCSSSTVNSAVVVGCTSSGLKKIAGSTRADVLRWNPANSQWNAERLFQSSNSGPHYVSFDVATNTWQLVYAPDLLGGACTKLADGLNLDPANVTNLYAVNVETTTPITAGAVVTIGGLDYDVVAILTAGTPGVIRIRPRFTVTVPQTIVTGTAVCVSDDQCPPFPLISYPGGIGAISEGSPIFCGGPGNGLRTFPPMRSNIMAAPLDIPSPKNINALGSHDSATLTFNVLNPSSVLPAHAHLTLSALGEFTINQDGLWRFEVLLDNVVVKSLRLRIPAIAAAVATDRWSTSLDLSFNQVFGLTPGQTITKNFKVRVETTNASSQSPAAEWETLNTQVHCSVNTYIP